MKPHYDAAVTSFTARRRLHQSPLLLFLLSTNSPVRSWSRSCPVWAQSSRGSIPSVSDRARLASDWPGPPSEGVARGSRAGRPAPPPTTWRTPPPWPPRAGWTAPRPGCLAASPGRLKSTGHCSAPRTAPWTAVENEGGEEEEKGVEEEERLDLMAREWTTERNSITDTFHCFLLLLFSALPHPLSDSAHTMNSEPLALFSLSLFVSAPYLFFSHTCTASVDGCSARASVKSKGVRRSSAVQSNTGHSMALMTGSRDKQEWKKHQLQNWKWQTACFI